MTSRSAAPAGALVAALALGWAAYAALAWLRYGRAAPPRAGGADPLDRFLPDPEVDEDHRVRVAAPPDVVLRTAMELDVQRSPLVWLVFSLRTLPARLRGADVRWRARGLVEEALAIGWGVLEEVPDRLFVAGAVTQPWTAEVEFRALPPEEFAAFEEPGFAKIVWSLEAEPLPAGGTIARTRTRVKTTDTASRRRFRRYWAFLSPGILLIRHETLRLLRREAGRR